MKILKKPLYSALIFFGTLIVLSVGYATWNATMSTVTVGNPLTVNSWNAMVDNINDLNSRLSQPGTVARVVTVQTRTQGTYTSLATGDGTEITPLNLVITPKKAGNKVILEWIVNGEANRNSVYIVTRNGVKLTDTTNASNNRWAGIVAHPYDVDFATTPDNAVVKIIDNNSLDIESTYKLQIRSSYTVADTLYLNRTVTSSGIDGNEASLSTGVATEIWN